jgi:uncharacterized membrane protein (DUF4010 family)
MDSLEIFQRLGLGAALGLLVGLQREYTGTSLAGIRTFPMVTLLGGFCALLSITHGGWIMAVGLLCVGIALLAGKFLQRAEAQDSGIATEIAVLLMFVLGAYLMQGITEVAVVAAGALAVLMHLKPQMHALLKRVEVNDIKAVMQFVLISLVILPVLPDKTFGPYQVLNPQNIWLMVVLIVGVQFAAYLLYRWFGQGPGMLLGGVLGGMVSSTATTLAYARQVSGAPEAAPLAATVIMLASTVSLVRVLIVAAFVAPAAIAVIGLPIGIMLTVLIVLSLAQALMVGRAPVQLPPANNPARLKPALIFAALYALVPLAIAASNDWFGVIGIYVVATVSGLMNMDAVTLSTTRMVSQHHLEYDIAWRVILVAALANLVFKAISAHVVGGAVLGRRLLILFGVALSVGVALLVFWPPVVTPPVPVVPSALPPP